MPFGIGGVPESAWRAQIAYCGWLLVSALVLRLAFVLAYPQFPVGLGDDAIYDSIGQHVAAGRGFVLQRMSPDGLIFEPQVRVGPAYPLFLAGLYRVFGHSMSAVRVAQAILGALTVVLAFRIAWLAFGTRVARLAGVLTALYPALIVYPGVVLTETSFAFLLVVCVWVAVEAFQRRAVFLWAVAGVLLGVAVLMRTEAIVLAPLLVATLLRFGPVGARARPIVLLGLAVVLTVGGWTLRNFYHHGSLIPVSSHGAATLWISTVGWSDWNFDDPTYRALIAQGADEVERARIFRQQALRNILDDPGGYLQLCLRRLAELWLGSHTTYLVGYTDSFRAYFDAGEIRRIAVKAALLGLNTAMIGMAAFGVALAFRASSRRRPLQWLCLHPIVAVTIVHFFLYSTSRYHVPVLPFVLMFSAMALLHLNSLRRSDSPA